MQGHKLYSNKRITDFDILEWPRMRNLTDFRGMRISKTGYEIDDEGVLDIEDKPKNSLVPLGYQISKRLRARHLRCVDPSTPPKEEVVVIPLL